MFETAFLKQDFFKEKKPVLILFVLVGLIQSIATFLLPVSIGQFFTIHFHSHGSKAQLLRLLGIHFKSLNSFFLFFLSLLIVKVIFEYLEKYICFQQGELYIKYIREKIFVAQMSWGTEKFKQKHFGKYLLRYSNDMKSLEAYLTHGIMGFWKNICFLILGFALLAAVNRHLALYLLLASIVIMGTIFFISKMQKKLISNSRAKRSNLLAMVTRSFQRHLSIKTKNIEQNRIDRFNKMSEELYLTNMENNRFESMLDSILPMLQFLMIGVLLLLMTTSYGAIRKRDALVFILTTLMMMHEMRHVLKVPGVINRGKISLNKINEILSTDDDKVISKEPPLVMMDNYKSK